MQKPGTTTPVASEVVVLPVQPPPPLDGSLLATCQELGLLGKVGYALLLSCNVPCLLAADVHLGAQL